MDNSNNDDDYIGTIADAVGERLAAAAAKQQDNLATLIADQLTDVTAGFEAMEFNLSTQINKLVVSANGVGGGAPGAAVPAGAVARLEKIQAALGSELPEEKRCELAALVGELIEELRPKAVAAAPQVKVGTLGAAAAPPPAENGGAKKKPPPAINNFFVERMGGMTDEAKALRADPKYAPYFRAFEEGVEPEGVFTAISFKTELPKIQKKKEGTAEYYRAIARVLWKQLKKDPAVSSSWKALHAKAKDDFSNAARTDEL